MKIKIIHFFNIILQVRPKKIKFFFKNNVVEKTYNFFHIKTQYYSV